jgi:hypothetical protein
MRERQGLICWFLIPMSVRIWMIPCAASAFTQSDSLGQPDTCRIVVVQDDSSHQAVAHVSIFNDEDLAAMTLAFRYGNGKSPVKCDSVRFWNTRSQFFDMRTERIDTVKQTVLIGLIADMSGNNPPMEKGDGEVARIYFTLPQGEKFQDFVMDTTWIRPFNVLKFVTPDVKGIYPEFDNSKATIRGGIPIPPPEEVKDIKEEDKNSGNETDQRKQSEG